MARRTREEAEQTRQTLLDTALRLYAEHGIHSISLKAIAAEAGVTHGALYWHFESRDHLICALAQNYTLPFEAHYLEALQSLDQDAMLGLKEFLCKSAMQVMRDPQGKQTFRLFYLRRKELPALAALDEILAEQWQQWEESIERFLKQARKQKQIRKKSKGRPYAALLLSQVIGALTMQELMPAAQANDAMLELSIETALLGVTAD